MTSNVASSPGQRSTGPVLFNVPAVQEVTGSGHIVSGLLTHVIAAKPLSVAVLVVVPQAPASVTAIKYVPDSEAVKVNSQLEPASSPKASTFPLGEIIVNSSGHACPPMPAPAALLHALNT